ncbi:MAG: o-succinylbenzoate---CoA ligase [Candidatus Hydrogenedentes bacterium]|nr:o-succinylbenzoate---CoA ligase [Candidatus Hydrogenedentota bacterium]
MPVIECPLARAAQKWPDVPALAAPDRAYTYREYDQCVSAVAGRLRDDGIAREDRVALALTTGAPYAILLMALLRLGAVACPLTRRLPPKALHAALDTVRAKALIAPQGFKLPAELVKYELLGPDIVDELPSEPWTPGPIPEEQPATIVFTSGSSAEPKAALHAYGNHYYSALASNENIPVIPGDKWLLSLPLHHVSGLGILFRCLVGGGTVVIPEAGEATEATLRRCGVTHVSLVATQLYRLLQDPAGSSALTGLKAILLGGSAIPDPLIRAARMRQLPIYTSYGLTEMATQVTTTQSGDGLLELRTSGRPLAPDTVRIADDSEIMVRGKTLFLGYVQGDSVFQFLDDDGWFATGDLGRLDSKGRLMVSGRKDNLFIRGGENIQPEEIEQLLCDIDGVVQALVTSVADEEFGQVPVAFVQMENGVGLDADALAHRLAQFLPPFKIPKTFYPWPDRLERPGAKLDREAFKKHAARLA